MTGRRPPTAVSAGQVAWVLVTAVFVATRAAAAWRAPVSGPELESLTGAWQASLGVDSPRFLGTLAQFVTSLVLRVHDGETAARLVPLAASATIPFALFSGRRALGGAGALAALALLAIDPAAIVLGSTAHSGGFDQAVAAWFLVALISRADSRVAWFALGAALGLSGPLPLLLATAAWTSWVFTGRPAGGGAVAAAGAGAVAGLLFASSGMGVADPAIRVPPIDLLAAGLEQRWSSATVADLTLMYEGPLLLAGAAIAAHRLGLWSSGREPRAEERLLLAWAGCGGAWWVVALGSRDPGAVLALSFPLCILVGAGLAPVNARVGRRAGAVSWAMGVGVVAGALLLLAGAVAVARGNAGEPLLSPALAPSAATLRAAVRDRVAEQAGGIVVHPDVAEATAWVLRDSGAVVTGTRASAEGAVVIWPAARTGPPGARLLAGALPVVREAGVPGTGVGALARWFRHRDIPGSDQTVVDVYTVGTP